MTQSEQSQELPSQFASNKGILPRSVTNGLHRCLLVTNVSIKQAWHRFEQEKKLTGSASSLTRYLTRDKCL